jgi:hypothetical protein
MIIGAGLLNTKIAIEYGDDVDGDLAGMSPARHSP